MSDEPGNELWALFPPQLRYFSGHLETTGLTVLLQQSGGTQHSGHHRPELAAVPSFRRMRKSQEASGQISQLPTSSIHKLQVYFIRHHFSSPSPP